jgi:hypothetical protein
MSRAPVISVAFVAALYASIAHADSVAGTRSELLVERKHEIALTMHYGHAELVVRRTVFNGGERHDQAMFWIDVPSGGVAVGLRTLGELHGRPHWFDGELLEAELAAERYRELTGIGGYYPKDPALLSWRSAEQLALQVFPCAPQAPKTIEYTLVLPTEYASGHYRIRLPQVGTDTLHARAELRGESIRDQIFVDGLPVPRGEVLALASEHEVSLARAEAPALEGGLAMVALSDERALFHYDFEAGRELSSLPRKADVVVLVDRSRSLGEDAIAAEVLAARSYLAHFAAPGLHARAAVVAFDRKPDDLLHGFAPVGEATALLEHTGLVAKNGSHVDAALDHAKRLFEAAPKGRARRIVLFTDRATRSALTVARLQTIAEHTGAVVHVADVMPGFEAVLERDDADAWSTVARATGGVSWHLVLDGEGADLARRREVLEELARPVRVHGLAVRAPGIPDGSLEVPATLDEGTAISELLLADTRVPHVIVTGELWAEPVRKVLLPDAGEAKLWSALVFGSELLSSLTEPEMMKLALLGRAVSPVTSYLAIEPGVRPSTEGLDEGEAFGLGGLGLIGHGSGGGGSGVGTIGGVDPDALMRAHLQRALAACGADGRGICSAHSRPAVRMVATRRRCSRRPSPSWSTSRA